jgi:hypothetical protein
MDKDAGVWIGERVYAEPTVGFGNMLCGHDFEGGAGRLPPCPGIGRASLSLGCKEQLD